MNIRRGFRRLGVALATPLFACALLAFGWSLYLERPTEKLKHAVTDEVIPAPPAGFVVEKGPWTQYAEAATIEQSNDAERLRFVAFALAGLGVGLLVIAVAVGWVA